MKKYFLFIGILFVAYSCKKKEEITISTDNVYVIKNALNSANNYYIKYWKNGVETIISDTTSANSTRCSSLFVDGEDVYIRGSEEIAGGSVLINKYWKNGLATSFSTAGMHLALVSNGDIYAAGYSDSSTALCYWKNGVQTPLSVGTNRSYITGFAADENVVGISGYEINAAGVKIAKYWKNGVATILSDGNYDVRATSVAVKNGDVYVVGTEESPLAAPTAKYWKNGIATNITPRDFSFATDIFVDGTDIYVSGSGNKPGGIRPSARYWKNGTPTVLTDGSREAYVHSIYVKGGDVYVTGYEMNDLGILVAKYWKNGVATILSNGTSDEQALDIVVQ